MGKTYFLVASHDTPPSGPIALGSIITSPRTPDVSLNSASIAQSLPINETSILDWSHMMSSSYKGKVGIWAKFLQSFGFGGDVSVEWDNSESAVYRFDQLITRTITPDITYTRSAFEQPTVQEHIRHSRFRANVYMIIGVKIARGADIAISKIRSKGMSLNIGVDLTPITGVPLQLGPDVHSTTKEKAQTSFQQPNDFVFAYRLKEIVYKKKVVVSQKDHLKGDLMGIGKGRQLDDEEEDDSKGEIEILGVKNEDLTAEEWEFEGEATTDDDGAECECVLLEPESDDD
ncbi:hypothetical protein G7Y89_g15213 [Cudoniella acicularis]|uniref:Uncharacterized protein n=1 Tax=Cudoniella acicularis TaxID=354080 RepID=A0A8H4QS53_9HELO|nr:hypothetical protein G7Y89_g15213 [Cudoniella acicularis]